MTDVIPCGPMLAIRGRCCRGDREWSASQESQHSPDTLHSVSCFETNQYRDIRQQSTV